MAEARRNYTPEEVRYLEDSWGVVSIKGIANHLGRNVSSVKQKAQHLGLTDARFHHDGITVCQLMRALNKSYNTIYSWIERYDLPIKHKLFCQENRVAVIGYKEFWKWAEGHKELINLAKMEEHLLGAEPEWAKVKRKADLLRSQRSWQSVHWTAKEDQRLKQLLQLVTSYPELAKQLNRSESSIKRRIYDLHLKSPKRLNNHIKYTPGDIQKLSDMACQGFCYETIARELGKSALGVRGKLERMKFDFKRRKFPEVQHEVKV